MLSMEEQFETACKDAAIPGAILLASNRSGTVSVLLSYINQLTHSRLFPLRPRVRRALSRHPRTARNGQHYAHSFLHQVDDLDCRHAVR